VVDVGSASTPEQRVRIVVDANGIEWEVYDDSGWSIGMALDWDCLPQTGNPGLIFSSRIDRRRIWPCPSGWQSLADEELLSLAQRARSML